MRRSPRTLWFACVGMVAALTLLPTTAAWAHGHASQDGIDMEIGFGTEPVYTGQPNSAQLILSRNGQPVTDLKPGDVTVEVTFGGETSDPIDMEPNFAFEDGTLDFGEAGDYRGWFTPSQPGTYTFHFTGTVDGVELDQTMSSGPKTFEEAQDLASSEFPAVNAPSNEDLATRIEQESKRASHAVAAAQVAATSASDAASTARTIAIIGLVLGAIGTIAGIGALARRRG
jgi:hypothetical protein